MIVWPRYMGTALLLAGLILLRPTCSHGQASIEPTDDRVYVSPQSITSLTVAPDGVVWAGTRGGIFSYDPATGSRRSFTRADGLPANEVRMVAAEENGVVAIFPQGADRWDGSKWNPAPTPKPAPILWRGKTLVMTPTEIMVDGKPLPLPPDSAGSHLTAVKVTPDGDLVVTLFGDPGLYFFGDPHLDSWKGDRWLALPGSLPDEAGMEITALAIAPNGATYVGTRRHGVFVEEKGQDAFEPIRNLPSEPYDHNAQAITRFHDDLYVSTLEDGLAVLSGNVWTHIAPPKISSDAPRQMVVFQDRLYVRHGNGKVDRFDGTVWTKDVFAALPRKQVTALATDGTTLYLAQWGGWSEWNGKEYVHHLKLSELQGAPLTVLCLAPDHKTLWIGTQGKGLAEADIPTGAIRCWHNELNGLTDDWITEIACASTASGPRTLAGTFYGGLCELGPDGRWSVVPGTEGENITGIAVQANGIIAATRHGVRAVAGGKTRLSPLVVGQDVEAQCLCPGETGLWVGTRTGLYFSRYGDGDSAGRYSP